MLTPQIKIQKMEKKEAHIINFSLLIKIKYTSVWKKDFSKLWFGILAKDNEPEHRALKLAK